MGYHTFLPISNSLTMLAWQAHCSRKRLPIKSFKGPCRAARKAIQPALFPLQEGKAKQLPIGREGKQTAHSSPNKLLLGEAKQLKPIQPDMDVRDLETELDVGSLPLGGRDHLSKWWPCALSSPLLTSA
jgi:hypothetical protein